MSDPSKYRMQLPPEQQAIQAKCFHPSGTSEEFPIDEIEQSIPERFEKIVQRYPERLSVKAGTRSLTYDELNRAANRIARTILGVRGEKSEPIALVFDHGIGVAAAVLGILKAGKFYVVLDASFPLERIAYILGDSQSELIVTDSRNSELGRKLISDGRRLLNIDELDGPAASTNLRLPLLPDDLASILYTSGSTGGPKGVAHSHRSQLHTVMVNTNEAHIGCEDRLTLLHSVGFGSAQAHLFQSLLNGAAVCSFDVKSEGILRLAKWLKDEMLTVYHSPPAVFRQFAEILPEKERLPSLRLIRLSGAPVSRSEFALYKKKFVPQVLLQIVMNSTEANVICSFVTDGSFSFPEVGSPAGYPVPGKKILLLDDNDHEVTPGEAGEIAVKSSYLPPGYWEGREGSGIMSGSRATPAAERLCKTGDIGRMRSDGFLIHLGRKDLMVKIRGYRVDISEIERVLLENPRVKEAAVAAWDREAGEKYLVAYVVPRENPRPTINELYDFLKAKLPQYMTPSAFVFMESLPLTNGKLDRTALLPPDDKRPNLANPYVGPGTELEQRLVKIWEDTLGIRPVGIDDDFFIIGGDSLSAARIIASIHAEWAIELRVQSLFESPTISRIAAQLAAKLENPVSSPTREKFKYLIDLQAGGEQTAVFFFPGGGGGEPEFFVYMPVIRRLGPQYPVYGLRAQGADGFSPPHKSVEQMATAYIEEIRSIQPHGPYWLIGECAGGVTAYEAARQLCAAGEEVELLALIDVERPTLGKYIFYRLFVFPEPIRMRWNYYVVRAKHHLQAIRNLPRSERLAYIVNQTAGIFTSEAQLLTTHLNFGQNATVMFGIVNNAAMRRHIFRIRENYRRAVRWYRPRPYDGKIEIFATEKLYRSDPTLGWSELVPNGLRIHSLPGNHWTSLRDHAEAAAAELRKCLKSSHPQSKLPNRKIFPPAAVSRLDRSNSISELL